MTEREPSLDRVLHAAGPASLRSAVAHLRARVVPGLQEATAGGLRLAAVVADVPVVAELTLLPDGRGVRLRTWPAGAATVPEAATAAWARRLLDLDADGASVDSVLGADPALAPLVAATPGLRLAGSPGLFETLVRTVLGQQVTVAAGVALVAQVVDALGPTLPGAVGAVTRGFPSPAAVAASDLAFLRMPDARRQTLRTVAAAVADGHLDTDPATPTAAVHAQLLGLKGVGPWTADYVALRGLGDRDAFPVGDVAIRRSAAALGLPDEPRQLLAHAERWRPHRAYAAQHLWDALA